MGKSDTWILVADAARAKVLRAEGRTFTPVEGMAFETPIPPTRDLGSDRPGRGFRSAGSNPHVLEDRSDRHREAKRDFAKRLARALESERRTGAFGRLVLIAPPQALGDVRSALSAATGKLVVTEIAKDLTRLGRAELGRRLAAAVQRVPQRPRKPVATK